MQNGDQSSKKQNKPYFIINDFFAKNGKTPQKVIEEYIIKEASNLI